MCPVCTLAVGAGLGLSRYLGIDDAVSGVWAGGLVISVSVWFCDWLKKKNYDFLKAIKGRYLIYLSVLFWTIFTYLPLWRIGIIGHPFNVIWGIDKLIFGSIVGAISFLLAIFTDKKVRKIKGRQLFNYQKVVFPVSFLVISSLLIYFYGGYLK
ncbi:MAG: hypothetical protein Q8P91_02670, partial [bacterium]|nr:hypothetical protein [bacterium]